MTNAELLSLIVIEAVRSALLISVLSVARRSVLDKKYKLVGQMLSLSLLVEGLVIYMVSGRNVEREGHLQIYLKIMALRKLKNQTLYRKFGNMVASFVLMVVAL